MRANPLPILIPLLVVCLVTTYLLFRWRRWAGVAFVGLWITALVVHITNTGVTRHFDEEMPFRVIKTGDYRTLELTDSRGDTFKAGSPNAVARAETRTNGKVRVSMTAWYDYGRLRAVQVQSVGGGAP